MQSFVLENWAIIVQQPMSTNLPVLKWNWKLLKTAAYLSIADKIFICSVYILFQPQTSFLKAIRKMVSKNDALVLKANISV